MEAHVAEVRVRLEDAADRVDVVGLLRDEAEEAAAARAAERGAVDAGPQRGDHVADEGRLRAVGHRLLLGPVGVERRAEPREVPGLERGRRAPRARDQRVRRAHDAGQTRVPFP